MDNQNSPAGEQAGSAIRSRFRSFAPLLIFLAVDALDGARSADCQTLWKTTGSLNQPRFQTPGTLLKDGRVLLVGALTCNPGCISYATAEIYDPAQATWTSTAPLNIPRFNHAIARLQNGDVLVAGGYLTPGVLTATCEVFDPITGNWTLTGSLNTPRQFQQGVALSDGRVLVVGGLGTNGQGGFTPLASAEIYDPATAQWSSAGTLTNARYSHTLTLLADGRVLALGGSGGTTVQNAAPLASAEIYDPGTNSWTSASPMTLARTDHTATLLPNGQVLAAGGSVTSGDQTRSAELYNPGMDQWTPAADMRAPRASHTATALPTGDVLVVGGRSNWVTAEIYDPGAGTWSPAAELNVARTSQSATLLNDGRVLTAGGVDPDNNHLASSELFDPDPPFHHR
jgi:hypothetical protein